MAKERGFGVISERWLGYDADHGTYTYGFESTLDIDARLAESYVIFDATDGHLVRLETRQDTPRSQFETLIIGLHFGAVRELGLAYRIFVCALGFPTALSITGIWIWWRKRNKRSIATA